MPYKKGQSGNPGGRAREKPFLAALNMEIAKRGADRKALRKVAAALLEKAEAGDMAAINALMDRLDGKAMQPVGGDEDHPFKLISEWRSTPKA